MRLKARSLGLMAEDYTTDAIEDVSEIYSGHRLIEDVSSSEIDMVYDCLLYTSPSPRDATLSRMPSSA